MTFSIVAADVETGRFGAAIATARPAVGARCVFGFPGTAAVATQAIVNSRLAFDVAEGLRTGMSLAEAAETALGRDGDAVRRQLLAVDAGGRGYVHTGSEVSPWCGSLTGLGFACAGNLLVGPEVLDDMARGFLKSEGEPLIRRLVAALRAGDRAGGDRRGRQSAAALIVGSDPWPSVDLRIDHDPDPVAALERLAEEWDRHWGHYDRTGAFPAAAPASTSDAQD